VRALSGLFGAMVGLSQRRSSMSRRAIYTRRASFSISHFHFQDEGVATPEFDRIRYARLLARCHYSSPAMATAIGCTPTKPARREISPTRPNPDPQPSTRVAEWPTSLLLHDSNNPADAGPLHRYPTISIAIIISGGAARLHDPSSAAVFYRW